jgi:Protein of unknown function (DUF3617)
MRRRSLLATFIVLASLTVGSAHAQAAGAAVLVPGLWEITVQTRTPILAAPLTHTVCIDKAHVTRPEPPKSRPNDDCQVAPDASAANETAYTVRCVKGKVTTTYRFIYSGDHFDGTVTIVRAKDEVHQVYTAKRISDCDDSPADAPVTSTAQ